MLVEDVDVAIGHADNDVIVIYSKRSGDAGMVVVAVVIVIVGKDGMGRVLPEEHTIDP